VPPIRPGHRRAIPHTGRHHQRRIQHSRPAPIIPMPSPLRIGKPMASITKSPDNIKIEDDRPIDPPLIAPLCTPSNRLTSLKHFPFAIPSASQRLTNEAQDTPCCSRCSTSPPMC
jgi:hypothetical protein